MRLRRAAQIPFETPVVCVSAEFTSGPHEDAHVTLPFCPWVVAGQLLRYEDGLFFDMPQLSRQSRNRKLPICLTSQLAPSVSAVGTASVRAVRRARVGEVIPCASRWVIPRARVGDTGCVDTVRGRAIPRARVGDTVSGGDTVRGVILCAGG